MMLGLLLGALIGAFAAFARAKIGVIAVMAFILAAGVFIAAARSLHPLGWGLLTIAAAQSSYLLIAYVQEYLQERASRRAMRIAIGQALRSTCQPQTALPRKIVGLVKALDKH
jgi:hypothetical protein